MKKMKALCVFLFYVVLLFMACKAEPNQMNKDLSSDRYNVAFLIMDGVYNTELTAPYDIFQHTQYRDGIKAMNVYTIAQSLDPVRSFEGLKILPDYSYKGNYPKPDILVVPSAEHHLDSDLDNHEMINWLRKEAMEAEYVTSHCDGAFVLAKAGLLNGIASNTFPSDIGAYKQMFPALDVRDSILFVHDGKFITSVGGARSFEAALYLCEHLYGKKIAERLAEGLVIDWDLQTLNYLKIED
jgi:transcriptional regulator GlxA family with amidase domain